MLQTRRGRAAALIAGAFALSACADSPMDPTSTSSILLPTGVSLQEGVESCQVIDFNQAQNTAVGNDFVTIFGNQLDFSGTRYTSVATGGAADLRILDPLFALGPDDDLRKTGVGAGECSTCNSPMLVINDPDDDSDGAGPIVSDNAFGGEIVISGFPTDVYIKSYQLADHEASEAPTQLLVGAVNIAPLVQPGAEHEVVTINTTSQPLIASGSVTFILGSLVTHTLGSAGIDNIEVCRTIVEGEEGCTPGFWKNHASAWAATGFTSGQNLESVFDVPDAYGLDNFTLLQALSFSGGSTTAAKAQILLRAAVAALLNAGHPDVDYAQSAASIITEVNAALASGSNATILALATELDTQNNAGCPISR